jgi:hypothetical protein
MRWFRQVLEECKGGMRWQEIEQEGLWEEKLDWSLLAD